MEQKERIIKLKAIKAEKELSVANIHDMIQRRGQHLSKTSISRLFQEGSEDHSFRSETVKLIETVMADDYAIEREKLKSREEQHRMEIEHYKQQITELEAKLVREKQRGEEKIEKEREQFNNRIEQLNTHINFLSEQIKIKDTRMDEKDKRFDKLFERFDKKEENFDKMIEQLLNRCSNCDKNK